MSAATVGTYLAIATDTTAVTTVQVAKAAKAGALSFVAGFKAEMAARKLERQLAQLRSDAEARLAIACEEVA